MATKIIVNGKQYTRPGVYSAIISGIKTTAASLPFGHVAILDSGIGAGYGGGDGGKIYTFETLQDFQSFVKGGELFNISTPLFVPLKGVKGVSKVSLIQARTATAATLNLTLEHGSVILTTKDKGINANGVTNPNGSLKLGYGLRLIGKAGKVKCQLLHGSYRGLDTLNGTSYDNKTPDTSPAIVVVESPFLVSVGDLKTWLTTNTAITDGLVISSFVADDLTLALTDNDIAAGLHLFASATETYNDTAYQAALDQLATLNNEFILSLSGGASAQDIKNEDLVALAKNGKYEKYVFIAGGATAAELDTISIAAADHYNSERVIVVHGDGEVSISNGGYKKVSSLYKTANILGRLCGLDPENPITLKKVGIDKETNGLNDAQLDKALDNGVTVSYFDEELGYVACLQAVNTLQDNNNLINENAASHDVGVERIKAQVNKEASITLKRKFYGNEGAVNRQTLTAQDIVSATDGFLNGKVREGLIVRYGNINVTTEGDVYYITYEFVPNYPVNKIVITGTMLDK